MNVHKLDILIVIQGELICMWFFSIVEIKMKRATLLLVEDQSECVSCRSCSITIGTQK